ncbi:unnamed protein product [Adineta steineri]|uniref:Sulphur transport domain-containing protein n=1 Tax=Adineta steineri TaxID=433720 RepID=A0A814QV78_9BILA|nr:unnamed protein product [Adineta steineri]CAF1124853.1 unnamed protein product [Adineta steineri]
MLKHDIDNQHKENIKSDIIIEGDRSPMLLAQHTNSINTDTSKTNIVSIDQQSYDDNKSTFMNILSAMYAIIFGILFGFLMNKGTVFVSPTIRKQMLFERFAMLKMFLAAVGVSMLSVALLVLFCGALYGKVLNSYIEHNSRRGVLHYIFGGTLIGLGMVVSGSCPGTVFVQVGSGILNSLFTCLGGLLGTYFYYMLIHDRVSHTKLPSTSLVLRRLCDVLHIHSTIIHTIFGCILLGAAIGLEYLIPWKSDLNSRLLVNGTLNPNEAIGHIFGMAAWPPSICGAGIGLLQLFFIFFLEKSLGVSSAFTVFAAQVCRIKTIGRTIPSMNSFAYGFKNYVTLLFALGAIGGSALSSSLSQTIPLGAENGTNILNSILGGFFLLLGARCAGGCTSGQGISGMTHLLFGSFLTTACIFGGGIIFAFTFSLGKDEWSFYNL